MVKMLRPNVAPEVRNYLDSVLPTDITFTWEDIQVALRQHPAIKVDDDRPSSRVHFIYLGDSGVSTLGLSWGNIGNAWLVINKPIEVAYSPVVAEQGLLYQVFSSVTCWPSVPMYGYFIGHGSDYSAPMARFMDALCQLKAVEVPLHHPVSITRRVRGDRHALPWLGYVEEQGREAS